MNEFWDIGIRQYPAVAGAFSSGITKEYAMHSGPTIKTTRPPRKAASFAVRSNRRSAANREPKYTQNARKHYEMYLALARAEALIGNTVGAENYYQHAEHYFRSMNLAS